MNAFTTNSCRILMHCLPPQRFAVKGETNVLNVLSATIQRAVNAEPAVMCETVCGTPGK